MSDPEEPRLGAEALRIVQALILSEPDGGPSAPAPEALVRFALGWSDEAEHARVVDVLTRDRSARERMLALRDEIRAGKPRSPELVGFLEAYLPGAVERFRATPRNEWSARPGPANPLLDGVLAALGVRLRGAPAPTAAFRGAETRAIEGLPGVEAELRASVESGDFVAVARLTAPAPGARLRLSLHDPLLGAVPLGEADALDGGWSLRRSGLGAAMGLPEGTAPNAPLTLAAGPAVPQAFESWAVELDRPGGEVRLRLPYAGPPTVHRGRLVLPLDVPPGLAESLRGYDLRVFLLTAPRPLLLGVVPWESAIWEGRVELPFPGADGAVPPEALELRATPP